MASARRLFAMLIAGALPAACGSGNNAAVLSSRMDSSLALQTERNQASVQRTSDGVVVRLPENLLFAPGTTRELTGQGKFVLINVTQALLEPQIMRIEVVPDQGPLSVLRAETVRAFYRDAQFSSGIPLVVTQPPWPKVVSREPLALYRATAQLPLLKPKLIWPAATIFPSDWRAMPLM